MIIFLDGNSGVGKSTIGKYIGSKSNNLYIPPYLDFSIDYKISHPKSFNRKDQKECIERVSWWMRIEEERIKYAKQVEGVYDVVIIDTSMIMVIIDEMVASKTNQKNALLAILNAYQNLITYIDYSNCKLLLLCASNSNLIRRRALRKHVDKSFQEKDISSNYNRLFENLSLQVSSPNFLVLNTNNISLNDLKNEVEYLINSQRESSDNLFSKCFEKLFERAISLKLIN